MAKEITVAREGRVNTLNVMRPMVSSRTRAYEGQNANNPYLNTPQKAYIGVVNRANDLLNRYPQTAQNRQRVANAVSNIRERILPFGWNGFSNPKKK